MDRVDPLLVQLATTLRAYVREVIAEELHAAGTPAKERVYSQLDGERPAGARRTKYLRTWRRAHEAGDPGATTHGRARLLTEGAWLRHGAAPAAPKAAKPVVVDLDAHVREELGLATKGAA